MSKDLVPRSYQALINSRRVSSFTRQALRSRGAPDDPAYRATAMTQNQLQILRAVIRRVLPQPDDRAIDIAARLDAQLDEAKGDGWRFIQLPDDRTAYAHGLATLENVAFAEHVIRFAALPGELQDEILERATTGTLGCGGEGMLDPEQMKLWFEDVRGDAAKLYMAHPATLARIGYSGIGYGGDGDYKPGFTLIGLDEREAWEPSADETAEPA